MVVVAGDEIDDVVKYGVFAAECEFYKSCEHGCRDVVIGKGEFKDVAIEYERRSTSVHIGGQDPAQALDQLLDYWTGRFSIDFG